MSLKEKTSVVMKPEPNTALFASIVKTVQKQNQRQTPQKFQPLKKIDSKQTEIKGPSRMEENLKTESEPARSTVANLKITKYASFKEVL